jgi:hypothetical protein
MIPPPVAAAAAVAEAEAEVEAVAVEVEGRVEETAGEGSYLRACTSCRRKESNSSSEAVCVGV